MGAPGSTRGALINICNPKGNGAGEGRRSEGEGRGKGRDRGRGGAEEGRMIDNKASCVSMLECIRMYGMVYK